MNFGNPRRQTSKPRAAHQRQTRGSRQRRAKPGGYSGLTPRFLLAVLSAAASLALPSAASGQKAVLVVRHAEKISEQDERLTDAGRARAARLAGMLQKSDVAAIYSTDTERTIGTAQPLAAALGLKIRIYDAKWDDGKPDFTGFVERLRRESPGGVVLVVGHSNTVPPLLRALGCVEEISIASNEYDDLFVVLPKEGGRATLLRLRY